MGYARTRSGLVVPEHLADIGEPPLGITLGEWNSLSDRNRRILERHALNPLGGRSEHVFLLANSAAPTTVAQVKQPTGNNALRTQLQIESPASSQLTVVEWAISFDGSAAATPVQVEFFGCTGAATMSTATVAADISKLNCPDSEASLITLGGTTHTGFATAAVTEGTVADWRGFDLQLIAPTGQFVKQWPQGREPVNPSAKLMRIRTIAPAAAVNCYCYAAWAE